jgi:hypothetical protein
VKFAALMYLALILGFTLVANAQQLSTIDTVQNIQINRAQDLGIENSRRIDSLASAVSELSGSINRGTGIVVGIGSTLTILQIIQMLIVRKRGEQ